MILQNEEKVKENLDEEVRPNIDDLEELPTVEETSSSKISIGNYVEALDLSYNNLEHTLLYKGEPITELIEANIFTEAYSVFRSINVHRFKAAMLHYGGKRKVHPIHDYINALPVWDGKDTIGELAKFFNAKTHPDLPTRRLLELTIVGMVRRWTEYQYSPCLVLASKQGKGIGKSYFSQWLCPLPDLFVRKPVSPDSKDDRILLATKMIWEIEELGATTSRKDVGLVKSFVSSTQVTERKPYQQKAETLPVPCSLIATVNDSSGFLTDVENRRFLILSLTSIDWNYEQQINKKQLYAQAYALLKKNPNVLKLTEAELEAQVSSNLDNRMESNADIAIQEEFEYVDDPTAFVSSMRIMNYLSEHHIQASYNAIASAMFLLGAEKLYPRIKGVKTRGFCKVREKIRIT